MNMELLDKALTQRTEVTERQIPTQKVKAKVIKLKAFLATMQALQEFLKEDLDELLKDQPLSKKQTKDIEGIRRYQQYLNSRTRK